MGVHRPNPAGILLTRRELMKKGGVGAVALFLSACGFNPTAQTSTPEPSVISKLTDTPPVVTTVSALSAQATTFPSTAVVATSPETSTVTAVAPSLEQLPITQLAVDQFVSAMKNAGQSINSATEILHAGLTMKEITRTDGIKCQVASTKDGYPLMIKQEKGEWRKTVLKDFFDSGDTLVWIKTDGSYVTDDKYHSLLAQEYQMVTLAQGNYWKWFERDKDAVTDKWSKGDIESQIAIIKKMQQTNPSLQVRVHPFGSFPEANPDWLKGLSKEEAQKQLKDHMQALYDVYQKSGITPSQYVVANEPYFQGSNWVRQDALYQDAGGYNYIPQAFKDARAIVGSDAVLLYMDTANNSKKPGVYNYYTELTKKNIDLIKSNGDQNIAVGMQMHLFGNAPLDEKDLIATMQYYGTDVYVTELDVDVSMIPEAQKAETLAKFYSTVYSAAQKSGVCRGVTTWNGVDSLSTPVDRDKKTGAQPTMFNGDYSPKLAYYAVMKELLNNQQTS